MRGEDELNRAIDLYSDTVKRICLIHLKNEADTEDIFQTVFLKYILSSVVFESTEHEKAWIIRVAINACKDLLKSFFRTHTVPLEEIHEQIAAVSSDREGEVLEAVLRLPEKYRQVIYLHFYEGYTAPQIAEMLGRNVNTVYTYIQRGKQQLKAELGGEDDADTQ